MAVADFDSVVLTTYRCTLKCELLCGVLGLSAWAHLGIPASHSDTGLLIIFYLIRIVLVCQLHGAVTIVRLQNRKNLFWHSE